MQYPDFFDRVPALTLYDPLAELLGAVDDGLVTYTYLDAVKLAGHSCPTVAGAYLMALKGIGALYPDGVAQRGGISVTVRGRRDEGTNGVVGNVIGLITGAAGDEGFKGLGGAYARNGLLKFGSDEDAPVTMMRNDTGAIIMLHYNPAAAKPAPIAPEMLRHAASGSGSPEERREFARLWQRNVAAILADHTNPELISVTHVRQPR